MENHFFPMMFILCRLLKEKRISVMEVPENFATQNSKTGWWIRCLVTTPPFSRNMGLKYLKGKTWAGLFYTELREISLRCSNCFLGICSSLWWDPTWNSKRNQIFSKILHTAFSLFKMQFSAFLLINLSYLWFVKLFRPLVKKLGFLVFCKIFVIFCLVKSWAGVLFNPWIWVN